MQKVILQSKRHANSRKLQTNSRVPTPEGQVSLELVKEAPKVPDVQVRPKSRKYQATSGKSLF